MGEVEGLIANQKLYNFVIAMLGLSVQQNAWPRIKARAGALQQNITNEPGEIITDYAANGDGVGYMNPPVFSQMPVELAGNILSVTKDVTGVSDIITGETTNMAASAIISLQNQARLPIQNVQNRFYRSVRNIGRIWEQFFKACYSSPRPYVAADPATGRQQPRLFEGHHAGAVRALRARKHFPRGAAAGA